MGGAWSSGNFLNDGARHSQHALLRPWRRTPPTHPYSTVTYGEWYGFHDSSSLMSPSPSLTLKVSLCSSRPVHISHHNITRQLAAHAASVMLIKITWAIHTSVAPLI